jgi:Autographiviridae endonuclease
VCGKEFGPKLVIRSRNKLRYSKAQCCSPECSRVLGDLRHPTSYRCHDTQSDRFWSKVENASGADCWQWLGHTEDYGYGMFSIKRNGKHISVLAHRMAWELRRGPIPDGLCVLHHCGNPGCVNPDHLFLDTRTGNMEDKVRKGRQAKGESAGSRKLTWIEACAIRRVATDLGFPRQFLANLYDVSLTTIRSVVLGITWREERGLDE